MIGIDYHENGHGSMFLLVHSLECWHYYMHDLFDTFFEIMFVLEECHINKKAWKLAQTNLSEVNHSRKRTKDCLNMGEFLFFILHYRWSTEILLTMLKTLCTKGIVSVCIQFQQSLADGLTFNVMPQLTVYVNHLSNQVSYFFLIIHCIIIFLPLPFQTATLISVA